MPLAGRPLNHDLGVEGIAIVERTAIGFRPDAIDEVRPPDHGLYRRYLVD
jgi:hypothetical protein